MGNCLRRQSGSSVVWAGDDWGSLTSKNSFEDDDDDNACNVERHRLLGVETGAFSLSSSSTNTSTAGTREVKITITKKELEELVGRADMQGLSTKQILSRLMDSADRYDEHQRPWRPALQSIPEVN
ncbi:uncharacterized protein LOC132172945 [Corylus avellana]|uniref:uncharacterized protein LOC132172945 n=1 Tax=Corylus avellana TaxID=13451 RepID=UPI001E21E643|nr:uncharacterized protein LOC132172945 [Corylus avellana]